MEDFRLGKPDQQKGGQSDKLLPDVKWRWLNDNFLRSWYFKNQSGELEQNDTEEDDDEEGEAGGEKKTVYGRFRKSFKKLLPEVVSKELSEDTAPAAYTAEEAWQPPEPAPEPGDTLEPYLGELSIDHNLADLDPSSDRDETSIEAPDIATPEPAQKLISQSEKINFPNEATTIAAKLPEEEPRPEPFVPTKPKQVSTQKYQTAKPSGPTKNPKANQVPETRLEPYPVPEFIKPATQESVPSPAIKNLTELRKKVTDIEAEIETIKREVPKAEAQRPPREAKGSRKPEATSLADSKEPEPVKQKRAEVPLQNPEKELPRGAYSIKEVFEKVQQAAEKGQPIEALFEKRQEIKDSRRSNDNAGGAPIKQKERQTGPSNPHVPKENREKPVKSSLAAKSAAFFAKDNDSVYKQAVFSGFWTGLVVVVVLTVILVTS